MARVTLNVTKYVNTNEQLPADLVCEWLDGLDVEVGDSRIEFGHELTVDFHGLPSALCELIHRYEPNPTKAAELTRTITFM